MIRLNPAFGCSTRAAAALAIAMGIVTAGLAAGPAGASSRPSFSLTSSGTPSITVSPGTGLAPAPGAPDAAGDTNATTQVALSASGFSPADTGGFVTLECNDDPNQPTFNFFGQTLPVGCDISLALGSPPPGTATVISGNVGSGNGSSCSSSAGNCDSNGSAPAQDAASYPCPPTPAQQASGYLCALIVVGISGKLTAVDLAAQPLEFTGELLPTMKVTGTSAGKAYPGETVTVSGKNWPVTPTTSLKGATQTITGSMSVCSPSKCTATPATATPPNVNSTGKLSGTMVIPVNGVSYPCTTGCYIKLTGNETISEDGLVATISAVDSAPISISTSFKPA